MTKLIILRPYQVDALEKIREHYQSGTKKVLLQMATGSGKTAVFSTILKSVHQKGNRAIMVVSGASLVDQASKRLDRENVPHGVYQANHWRRMPDEKIQLCSIHTLYARKIVPEAILIVVDEAHLASSPMFHWLIKHYPNAFILAVTATPYSKKGLKHLADVVVFPIGIEELMDQGYLVRPKYFVPSKINLQDVKIDKRTGDYKTSELEVTVSDTRILGDIVTAWKNNAAGRPTLCFAVTVKHSLALVENFNENGIRAVHIEAGTPKGEREIAIKQLESGEIDIISNVGILTTGVDIPAVSCIILARPTRSYTLYLQICGRGTRTFPGKENFIILDHAGCVEHHGFIEHEQDATLDGKPKVNREISVIICEVCFTAYEGPKTECPACGFKKEASERNQNFESDKTVELVEVAVDDKMSAEIEYLIEACLRREYSQGWIFHQVKERFGETYAKANWRRIKKRYISLATRHARISDHLGDFPEWAR